MQNFMYYAPTKVYFGKNTHKNVGEIIKGYGFGKIMMQYGKSSIKKTGLYDEVMKSLKDNGIEVVEMGGVEPNPKLDFIREAVKIAKENSVEMILAVGGGSVIDSSKFTAAGAVADCDVWDFPTRKNEVKEALPVGTILTISAAGSEMSANAVMTNMEENMKRGYGCDSFRCLFSILNPELTYSVSKYQTACGIVDIMAHTMERYFTPVEPTLITDGIAESILRTVIESGRVLMDKPDDYEARANVMWASSLSHNNLTSCGRESYLAVHQLEHALSGEYDEVAHGAGLAVLYPAWARYVYKLNISRFVQFARNVWGVEEKDDEKAAVLGIERMEEFFAFIEMPSRISDFGLGEVSADRLADLCTYGRKRTVRSFEELDFDKIKEIFESCL